MPKKHNKDLFTGIPLTSGIKNDKHHFHIGLIEGVSSTAILSQSSTFSSKRLYKKMGVADSHIFTEMKSAARIYIFGS
jgi:hypothetical protein